MPEVSMWLYPVLIAAAVGLFIAFRFNIRWSWGLCAQEALIFIAATLGLLALYFPATFAAGLAPEAVANFWAATAWILFGVFNFGQRMVLNRLNTDISLYKIAAARRRLVLVRLLVWGPPARYWAAMADAAGFYQNGEMERGDELLGGWRNDRRVPAQAKEGLLGVSMMGRAMSQDWHAIVNMFEVNQQVIWALAAPVPLQMAGRAYAELGRYPESLACLQQIHQSSIRLNATNLDICFSTFFALAGALPELGDAYEMCKDRRAFPQYARDYWLARCYAVRGEIDRALELYRVSLNSLPPEMTSWRKRAQQQADRLSAMKSGSIPAPQPVSVAPALIADAGRIYKHWRLVSELVRPARAGVAVTSLMVLLIASFVISNPDMLPVSDPSLMSVLKAFHRACYALGELSATSLFKGEWWRLLTYLFLHGNWAHLLLNTAALYLFGKSAEKVFGSGKFLAIFVASGVLSGFGQVLLTPNEAAIGASGAVLGIFGAVIAGMLRLGRIIPARIRQYELRWMLSIAIAQVIFDQIVNNIAAATDQSQTGARIAAFAHIGGLFWGFLLGMIVPLGKWKESEKITR